MDPAAELDIKLDRLRRLMHACKAETLLLRTRANLAWLTGGGVFHVNGATDTAIASLLVQDERITLITSNIEAQRLIDEQLPVETRDRFTVVGCDWWSPRKQSELLGQLVGSQKLAIDTGGGADNLGPAIAAVRGSLTEAEVRRYMADGPALATTLEVVASQVRRGMTESEIAAMIGRVLGEIGFRVAVCLVGADDRIDTRRHPMPTDRNAEHRAMLVAVAERSGLYCAATRIVSLGEPDGELRRKMRAVSEINATAITASEPGRDWRDVLAAIVVAYEEAGYADEWRLHHQGGSIGYQPRDMIVTPETEGTIAEAQAIAWNPTIAGVKCEDTIITGEGGRLMLCGPGADWPAFEIERDGKVVRCADMLVTGG